MYKCTYREFNVKTFPDLQHFAHLRKLVAKCQLLRRFSGDVNYSKYLKFLITSTVNTCTVHFVQSLLIEAANTRPI
jgi:hypothetical protein